MSETQNPHKQQAERIRKQQAIVFHRWKETLRMAEKSKRSQEFFAEMIAKDRADRPEALVLDELGLEFASSQLAAYQNHANQLRSVLSDTEVAEFERKYRNGAWVYRTNLDLALIGMLAFPIILLLGVVFIVLTALALTGGIPTSPSSEHIGAVQGVSFLVLAACAAPLVVIKKRKKKRKSDS
jgi:hypothetical protein